MTSGHRRVVQTLAEVGQRKAGRCCPLATLKPLQRTNLLQFGGRGRLIVFFGLKDLFNKSP